MKQSALIALLPVLASLAATPAAAHPHKHHAHHHHDAHDRAAPSQRKSLGFGPAHAHAEYRLVERGEAHKPLVSLMDGSRAVPAAEAEGATLEQLVQGGKHERLDDLARRVAIALAGRFVGEQDAPGSKWLYIRDDSYTDPRSLISHVYFRQVINGLEVSDGDINVNVDRHGRVLSYGSSFFPGPAPLPGPIEAASRSSFCSAAEALLQQHKAAEHAEEHAHEAASGLGEGLRVGLSAVGNALFGEAGVRFVEAHVGHATAVHDADAEAEHVKAHRKHHRRHLKQHVRVLCKPEEELTAAARLKAVPASLAGSPRYDQDAAFNEAGMYSARQALALVLPDLLPKAQQKALRKQGTEAVLQAMESSHDVQLTSHYAHAEPPVEVIRNVPFVQGDGSGKEPAVKARLVYHQAEQDGEAGLRLCWRFDVPLEDNWYDVHVDTVSGEMVGVVDYVSDAPPSRSLKGKGDKQKPLPKPSPPKVNATTDDASYGVFPFGINDPSHGNISVVSSPWDLIASPAGWHAFPDKANSWVGRDIKGVTSGNKVAHSSVTWTNATTTIGNNVFAQEDWAGQSQWLTNFRPENKSMTFDYEYGEPLGLRPQEYVDFAVTQLFYTSNMYHDLLYRLGFDEISGNFQMENWGNGGRGGDAVLAYAQAGEGTNNANFATPPDGTMPRMRMYLWSTATPYRDGDLEAGIVIHEYSHGLSTRLTGGPMNSGCLGYGEAGGMGEGIGDAIATIIRQIEERTSEYSMGAWAANNKKGIRNYVYSSNSTTNPSTYKILDKPAYWGVHAIGEVWAEMIFTLEELLVAKHGFSKTLFPPLNTTEPNDYYREPLKFDLQGRPSRLVPRHGNTLMLQLFVDGMKLQPCRPSFVNARDSILTADVALTGGENACEIWEAFAGRGLGVDAALKGQLPWGGGIREEDYTKPKTCKGKK